MHSHTEIIMPPTDDIEAAVKQIMAPFNEQPDDDDEDVRSSFWDFWVIGGRWAGHKLQAGLDQDKLKAFHDAMTQRKVTVDSIQGGKQALKPESQIPVVDAMWHEFFPETTGPCPLFKHSNDQYYCK